MVLANPRALFSHLKYAKRSMIERIEDVYLDFLYDCHVANKNLTTEDWEVFGKENHHVSIPKQDGGELTPLNSQYLTTYQHWIAGVLQSKVLQKCCFACVPKGVLPPYLEELRLKWNRDQGYKSLASGVSCCSPQFSQLDWVKRLRREVGLRLVSDKIGIHSPSYKESPGRKQNNRKRGIQSKENREGIHALSFEERSNNTRKYWDNMTPEERSSVAKRSAKTVKETYSLERKLERSRKISRHHSPRPIILTTPQGEEIFYELIFDACLEHGLESCKIGDICKGRRKTHKGFTARYAD